MRDIKKLTAQAEVVAGSIKRDVNWVILKKEKQTVKTFLNILLFVNHIDLIYRNVIQLKTGKVVSQQQLAHQILEYKNNQEFTEAYNGIKGLRNSIVHSTLLENSLHNYFTIHKGIERILKLKKRIQIVIENIKEDISFIY